LYRFIKIKIIELQRYICACSKSNNNIFGYKIIEKYTYSKIVEHYLAEISQYNMIQLMINKNLGYQNCKKMQIFYFLTQLQLLKIGDPFYDGKYLPGIYGGRVGRDPLQGVAKMFNCLNLSYLKIMCIILME
jgi:hypothetical protein